MSGDDQHKHSNQDFEAMKRKYQELLSDSEMMRAKIICLDSEKEEALKQLRRSREIIMGHRKELTGLQEHLHFKKEMESQIENYKKYISDLQTELERIREVLKDTENDMSKFQHQYQDAMDLVEKLTQNNVDLKIKVSSFSSELDVLRNRHSDLQEVYSRNVAEKKASERELRQADNKSQTDKVSRDADVQRLEQQLQERDEEILKYRLQIEESQNDKRLICRNYNSTLKDLKRQLNLATKANLIAENGRSENDSSEHLSIKSRTSSCTSLDLSHPTSLTHSQSFNGNPNGNCIPSTSEDQMSSSLDIDKAILIEKILKLQRELARKDEKCDFLEDHVALLTLELKKRPK